jgi:RHS repeat-associated protein
MPARSYKPADYRFGFNGKENDDEVKGSGNQIDYGMRVHDPRLARFLSVDPLYREFTWNSTYAYAENEPISNIDMDGLEKVKYYFYNKENGKTYITTINFSEIKTEAEVQAMLEKHSHALRGHLKASEIMKTSNNNEIWEVTETKIGENNASRATYVHKYASETDFEEGRSFSGEKLQDKRQHINEWFCGGKSDDPANEGYPIDLIGIEASAGGGSVMAGYIEGDGGFINGSVDIYVGKSAPSIRLVFGKYYGNKKPSSKSLTGFSINAEVGYGLTVGGSADISNNGEIGRNWRMNSMGIMFGPGASGSVSVTSPPLTITTEDK